MVNILPCLKDHESLRFDDYKVSYLILKPNAARHYESILKEIKESQFTVHKQYAIMDYETVNMALHIEQTEAMKYIIPMSRTYNDFYGNYGILIVIAKCNITYENFCRQVVSFKRHLRAKYDKPYVSYAFNTCELGLPNEQQRLIIRAKNGDEVEKNKFNEEGTFMVFSINEIHSPDESVESTIKELQLLQSMSLLDESNVIPKAIISWMREYKTFEFLKDML